MILVVIVHFGPDLEMLKRCIFSFLKYESEVEILVVNNNKAKLSAKELSKDERLSVINNEINRGYGGGFNSVLSTNLYKKCSYVLLVNNDTYINGPIIKNLIDVAFPKDVGIVGPVVEYEEDKKKKTDLGGFVNSFGFIYHKVLEGSIKKSKPYLVDFLGVCLLIKRDVVSELKGFDEDFFLYFEDVDFCLRAKDKGYKVMVNPKAIIIHGLSKSVGKDSSLAVYNQTRSAIIYSNKHLGLKAFTFLIYVFLNGIKRTINSPKTGIEVFKAFGNSL